MVDAYTGKGDDGNTSDYGGNRMPKDDVLIEINGSVDNLQSALDMSIFLDDGSFKDILNQVQKKLWQVAGEVANCPGDCLIDPVTEKDLEELEKSIDGLGEPPNKFVRFNTQESIWFNECRVRCRSLERIIVKLFRDGKLRKEVYSYVNRLSSLFFMLGYKTSN